MNNHITSLNTRDPEPAPGALKYVRPDNSVSICSPGDKRYYTYSLIAQWIYDEYLGWCPTGLADSDHIDL